MSTRIALRVFSAGILVVYIIVASVFPSALAAEGKTGPGSLVVGETLEDFFTAAIDFSPQLRIAGEGLNIGRARERQAQGQLQPQVNANANLTDNSRNSLNQIGQPLTEQFDGERFSVSV